MRRVLLGCVVAAAMIWVPLGAWAGNQEVAEQIAANLRESGQLRGYKIGVKFQDGTAWLRGRVSSQEQMSTALRIVFQTPGVTRVVNNLSVDPAEPPPAPVAPASTAVSFGRVQSVTPPASQPMPTNSATQSLQPVATAYGPEPSPRSTSLMGSVGTLAQSSTIAPPADRVPASFSASPVQPTGATTVQEPTLAPALGAASVAEQPVTAAPASKSAQPIPIAYSQAPSPAPMAAPMPVTGAPLPQYVMPIGGGVAPARYDQPNLPNYAWPSYAAYPNYAALTYPKQYSPTVWPYIGPFYPYPQVPLGWRKVTLEWHDGWWFLDFDDGSHKGPFTGLFRPCRLH